MGMLFLAAAVIIVCYWFFRSPMSGAVAESLRRQGGAGCRDPELDTRLEEAVERLHDEVGAMRAELVELAERVDFTERMLTEVRQRAELPVGRDS